MTIQEMGEPEEQPRHEVEQAIACFERLHGVLVTVHDYEGRLRGFVGQQRLVHRHQLCLAAKGTNERLCVAADTDRVQGLLLPVNSLRGSLANSCMNDE